MGLVVLPMYILGYVWEALTVGNVCLGLLELVKIAVYRDYEREALSVGGVCLELLGVCV